MPSVLVYVQNFLAELLHPGDRGATAVEYALIAALIAAVIVAAVTVVGIRVTAMFTNVANAF
ncbi:MAG TPA: Flp family type IVb pilin [Streptosporangiaceae bacterium]|nr:Flp family type IVb pilin [Streptosporangiaceae bacterium]